MQIEIEVDGFHGPAVLTIEGINPQEYLTETEEYISLECTAGELRTSGKSVNRCPTGCTCGGYYFPLLLSTEKNKNGRYVVLIPKKLII